MTGQRYDLILVPMWMPSTFFSIVLFAAIVPRRLIHHRRRKRRKLGLCVKCGYDLRGSAERCPECGTPFDESLPTKNFSVPR